jgi:hypothetical protein
MAEYIERGRLQTAIQKGCKPWGYDYYRYVMGWSDCLTRVRDMVRKAPAADVAPVVRCKDCKYSYDEISYLCCSHGVCADCEVPPNFYCAEGKRKEPLTNDSRGGNNV